MQKYRLKPVGNPYAHCPGVTILSGAGLRRDGTPVLNVVRCGGDFAGGGLSIPYREEKVR